MNELIKITTNEQGLTVVPSARELYEFLGFDNSQWSRWSKKNIVNNPYAQEGQDWERVFDIMSKTSGIELDIMSNGKPKAKEGDDWVFFDIKSKNTERGRPTLDYTPTLDFAKRLSMLARTEKGEEIRRYFIECEKRAHGKISLLSVEQTLLQQAQALFEQGNQIAQLKQELSQLQRKITSGKQSPLLFSLSEPRQIVITPALPDLDSMETHDLLPMLRRVFAQKDSFRFSELLASMVKASAFVGPMLGRNRTQKLLIKATKLGYLVKERAPGQQYPTYRLSQLGKKK